MRKVAVLAAVFVAAAFFLVGNKKAHAETPEENKPESKTVVIESGDSLSKIAGRNNTTYPRLFYANPKIEDPDLIYAGDTLRVPGPNEELAKRPMPGEATSTHTAPQPQQATVSQTPPPEPTPEPAPAPSGAHAGVWDQLAQCESSGNWHINTGNGYYGGLQFSLSTWRSVGGSGYPHQASKAEQIHRGQILQARSGWGQWPACSAKLGLL